MLRHPLIRLFLRLTSSSLLAILLTGLLLTRFGWGEFNFASRIGHFEITTSRYGSVVRFWAPRSADSQIYLWRRTFEYPIHHPHWRYQLDDYRSVTDVPGLAVWLAPQHATWRTNRFVIYIGHWFAFLAVIMAVMMIRRSTAPEATEAAPVAQTS